MKNTLYLFLSLTLLASCDTGEDSFYHSNQAPTISIKGHSHTDFGKHQSDSVKFEEVYYQLDYLVLDEEKLDIDVAVDSIFRYEIEEDKIVFGAEKIGASNVYITVTDAWKREDKLLFNLTCFENLPPVASLQIDALQNVREYKFDAKGSYDTDAKYGGKIVLYRFFVNDKEIEKSYHTYMNYTFPKSGEYKIGVQVKDNNDEWSAIVQKTLTI
ncbi:hypothetical protein SAMN06265379_11246 [Saccharicrinis carchari]|uniref:PKD domain-containing protein n=1 Tax=Saccharicrinis carchari TaxID=1168039 RepID=A0A521F042_SACCC|nr:PKD domain-containing protein [Saccharicrinis carchari]SMO89493.1 hypothetical protein SAMN06265379_11246 [Saccharicrinis carchari]